MNPNTPEIIEQDRLPGGAHWSLLMRKGRILRLTDLEGQANVGMLFYNPQDKSERYNAPDTLKCQHTFKLTRGHCLYSDMGRIFCSIVEDSVGWHDTVGGNLTDAALAERWPVVTYQEGRNDWTISGEQSFLVELVKHGMDARDMAANLNLFSKVAVDETGNLLYAPDNSPAGSTIDLRFEMDTLVLMHTCPHPLNKSASYPKRPVQYQVFEAPPMQADDACFNSREENRRGFENTRIYLQRGAGQ